MYSDSIRFEHLHIFLPHVGDHISIFGFQVNYYGMIIAFGLLCAGFVIIREAKRLGYSEEDFLDLVFFGMLFGVIGARIYYVIFSLDRYRENWLSVFNLRQGGLAIYGGIIGGTITVYVLCKKKKIPFLAAMDIIMPGVLIGQILGRWGNFFNREAFGGYTDSLFAMQIPAEAVRQPEAVTAEMTKHAFTENGLSIISVHPTFLYESLWNLGVLLLLLAFRRKDHADGQIFFAYLFFYGLGRIWIESLRTDQLTLFGTGIPVSQIVAAVCIGVGAGAFSYLWKTAKNKS